MPVFSHYIVQSIVGAKFFFNFVILQIIRASSKCLPGVKPWKISHPVATFPVLMQGQVGHMAAMPEWETFVAAGGWWSVQV